MRPGRQKMTERMIAQMRPVPHAAMTTTGMAPCCSVSCQCSPCRYAHAKAAAATSPPDDGHHMPSSESEMSETTSSRPYPSMVSPLYPWSVQKSAPTDSSASSASYRAT